MTTEDAKEGVCWSCGAAMASADNFCRKCGAPFRSPLEASTDIHNRLRAVEKLQLRTAIGVFFLIIICSWLLLQLYHFGRGGPLG